MNQDYAGAIAELTKAIEIKSDFGLAYYNRGVIKNELNDRITSYNVCYTKLLRGHHLSSSPDMMTNRQAGHL